MQSKPFKTIDLNAMISLFFLGSVRSLRKRHGMGFETGQPIFVRDG